MAEGLHCFEKCVGRRSALDQIQVTGPLSFALTVTDENKGQSSTILYFDIAVKGMGLKAVWLLEQFKPFADNVIVFFDERA
jgi:hypothetical protein